MSNWHTLNFYELDSLPASPGVYAIYDKTTLLYIGQSENLLKQLRAHRHFVFGPSPVKTLLSQRISEHQKKDLRIKYKVAKICGEWLALEYRLVAKLKPPLNGGSATWSPSPASVLRVQRNTGRDYCHKCHTGKAHRYMYSKTWCKLCVSRNPKEWKATGERSFRYKKRTAHNFQRILAQ